MRAFLAPEIPNIFPAFLSFSLSLRHGKTLAKPPIFVILFVFDVFFDFFFVLALRNFARSFWLYCFISLLFAAIAAKIVKILCESRKALKIFPLVYSRCGELSRISSSEVILIDFCFAKLLRLPGGKFPYYSPSPANDTRRLPPSAMHLERSQFSLSPIHSFFYERRCFSFFSCCCRAPNCCRLKGAFKLSV
jgi:hypothetical protein